MRRLNQALVAEVRSRLKKEILVHPLAAVADESGKVNLIETDQNDSPEVLTQKLRDAAGDNQVFAASLCTLVERTSPRGGDPIPFIQMHTEDRSGLAVVAGVPADENENAAGLAGVAGPSVGGYMKKVSPIIFAKQ